MMPQVSAAGVALLIALLAGSANAAVYRCDTAAGVEYRDTPCTVGGQSTVNITNARMEFRYHAFSAARTDVTPSL